MNFFLVRPMDFLKLFISSLIKEDQYPHTWHIHNPECHVSCPWFSSHLLLGSRHSHDTNHTHTAREKQEHKTEHEGFNVVRSNLTYVHTHVTRSVYFFFLCTSYKYRVISYIEIEVLTGQRKDAIKYGRSSTAAVFRHFF